MRQTTSARLVWYEGIDFGALAKKMVDYFQTTDLRFHKHREPDGIFFICREARPAEFLSRPWESDPISTTGFVAASWYLKELNNSEWGSFTYARDAQLWPGWHNRGSSVVVLHFCFEDRFPRVFVSEEEFRKAVRKYYQVKDLFKAMDCDELVGVDQQVVHILNEEPAFPNHRDKDFRFAKRGTQVLVWQMEEREPKPRAGWENGRIFIDPPGAEQLTAS